MNYKISLALLMIAASFITYGQNQEDALRYSRLFPSGSARHMGMGGAMGSVGADMSMLGYNPAGIGLYRSSEFAFTPFLSLFNTDAVFQGETRDDNRYGLGLGQLGAVFVRDLSQKESASPWKMVQFGISLNRINHFNNRIWIEGFNNNSSMMTGYVHMADGTRPENLNRFDTKLAYDALLIWETDPIDLLYDTDAYRGGINQMKTISTGGSMNEVLFSLGANYNDRLYLGASLGIPYIRYSSEIVYRETDTRNQIDAFNQFERIENLETRGTGFNLKFGAIFRATDWLRLGGAIHTPTFFPSMSDSWRSRMSSDLVIDNESVQKSVSSPEGSFDYELTTPFRAIGSATVLFGNIGLISADYELIDYSEARLNSDDYKFFDANSAIRANYTSSHNFRFGTEWRLNELYFRGGYAIFGSSYQEGVNNDAGSQYSLGIGVREKGYFIDLGFVSNRFSEDRFLYWVPTGDGYDFELPRSSIDFSRRLFLLTFGWRF